MSSISLYRTSDQHDKLKNLDSVMEVKATTRDGDELQAIDNSISSEDSYTLATSLKGLGDNLKVVTSLTAG